MKKIGRNNPCPCGSGQKYKHCCLAKDSAMAPEALAAIDVVRRHLSATMDASSNAFTDLVETGRLDEAEQLGQDLLARHPDEPDHHERIGMSDESRGKHLEAADCYRKVVDLMRAHPGDDHFDLQASFVRRIAELDPSARPC